MSTINIYESNSWVDKLEKIQMIIDEQYAAVKALESHEEEFKKLHPVLYREEIRRLEAEALLHGGGFETLDAAAEAVNEQHKNRENLEYCKQTADKYMEQLSPLEFKGLFRMDRTLFNEIVEDLREHFIQKGKFQSRKRGKKVTPTRFLLAGTLRWLAGGSPHDICFFCGVRMSTFKRFRWDVLDALHDLYFDSEISMPTSAAERDLLSARFAEKTKMEGILGAIDGLLLHIHLMPHANARAYRCYKAFYALNMQGVAGPDGEFLYVNIGHKGATGDGTAARES